MTRGLIAPAVSFRERVEGVFAGFATEIRDRALILQIEIESEFVVPLGEDFDTALRELIRLVLASIPDGCEIYFGAARSQAPVSRIGAGAFRARWQVLGESSRTTSSVETLLRPRHGSAAGHASSTLARRVEERFARTDWTYRLEVIADRDELVATGSRL